MTPKIYACSINYYNKTPKRLYGKITAFISMIVFKNLTKICIFGSFSYN